MAKAAAEVGVEIVETAIEATQNLTESGIGMEVAEVITREIINTDMVPRLLAGLMAHPVPEEDPTGTEDVDHDLQDDVSLRHIIYCTVYKQVRWGEISNSFIVIRFLSLN